MSGQAVPSGDADGKGRLLLCKMCAPTARMHGMHGHTGGTAGMHWGHRDAEGFPGCTAGMGWMRDALNAQQGCSGHSALGVTPEYGVGSHRQEQAGCTLSPLCPPVWQTLSSEGCREVPAQHWVWFPHSQSLWWVPARYSVPSARVHRAGLPTAPHALAALQGLALLRYLVPQLPSVTLPV